MARVGRLVGREELELPHSWIMVADPHMWAGPHYVIAAIIARVSRTTEAETETPLPAEELDDLLARIWRRLGGRSALRKRTCLPWEGATSGSYSIPIVNIRKPGGGPRDRTQRSVRRLLWEQLHGTTIPAGHALVTTCGTEQCVNPHHLVPSMARRRSAHDDPEIAIEAALRARGRRCVHWTGARARDYPVAWIRDDDGQMQKRSARAVVLERAGIPPSLRLRRPSCGDPMCVQINHLVRK